MKKTTTLSGSSDRSQSQQGIRGRNSQDPGSQEQNRQQNPYAKRSQSRYESGVVSRAFLVIALSLTLVGVLRWALNVTNANARQISNNLTRLQGHYDNQGQSASFQNTGSFRNTDAVSIRPSRDPVIEPETH